MESSRRSVKRRKNRSIQRHYVVHNYHDFAHVTQEEAHKSQEKRSRRRGGVAVHFPVRLHEALSAIEADGHGGVIGWMSHGRCFVIHKPRDFEKTLMPKYFSQSKFPSFQRQLNLYGFQRLTRGPDASGYYHELFLRGKPYLADNMQRQTIKGTNSKAAANPDAEPNFYAMPPVNGNITCPSPSLSAPSLVTNETDSALGTGKNRDSKNHNQDNQHQQQSGFTIDSGKASSEATVAPVDMCMMSGTNRQAVTPVHGLRAPPNLVPSRCLKRNSSVPSDPSQVFGGDDEPSNEIDSLIMQDVPMTTDLGSTLLDFLNEDIFAWNSSTPV